MKKAILLLITILFLISSLFSCSENNNTNTQNSYIVSDVSFADDISDDSITSDTSYENSTEEPVVEAPEPSDTIINFIACPDNIIHPSVFYDAIEREAAKEGNNPDYSDLHNAKYDFSQIYEYVAEDIGDADIAYINQETLIGGTSGKIIGYPCFNSPAPVADTIAELGFDVVNVAHNHMLDSKNTKYLENCYNVFNNYGLDVIGYYPNEDSTNDIIVIERDGIKVSFLSYTYGTNGIDLPNNSDFVIPYFNEELIRKQVAIAKAESDIIIASCHWGYENTYNINSEQKKYAKLFSELEVDIVLGMHPHVVQPIEWIISESGYKTLVIYSLGNFVSGMVGGRNMLAGIFSVNFRKDFDTGIVTIEFPEFIPIVTHYTKEERVASNDTGYRNFKIYYLEDYTDDLASQHGVVRYEKSHGTTLVGGAFSTTTLINTLQKYIPSEFLPSKFKNNS